MAAPFLAGILTSIMGMWRDGFNYFLGARNCRAKVDIIFDHLDSGRETES
jgi:hypothetical protein